jgi:SAM-dependent methyltransferase
MKTRKKVNKFFTFPQLDKMNRIQYKLGIVPLQKKERRCDVVIKTSLKEVKAWRSLTARNELDDLLEGATRDVRPSDKKLVFYNMVGRAGYIGTLLTLLTSPDAIRVIGAAWLGRTDAALQVIYDHKPRWYTPFDNLWQGCYNCRSVRARGDFVRSAVRFLIKSLVEQQLFVDGSLEDIVVVSLGSGSASQLLQGIKDSTISNLRIVMVDRDAKALDAGQKNVQRLGLMKYPVEYRRTTIGSFLRSIDPETIDLVEMVGLADYFKERRLEQHFKGIYRALAPGGVFLGANISSDEEAAFAHGAIRWPKMFYRSRESLLETLNHADFEEVWTGQCGLYTVWASQKLP